MNNISINNQLLLRFEDIGEKGNSCREEFLINSSADRDSLTRLFVIFHQIKKDYQEKTYYICKTVYDTAKMIKINYDFDFSILKNIKNGNYNYLLGNDKMLKFSVKNCNLCGIYIDNIKNINYFFEIRLDEKIIYSIEGNIAFIEMLQIIIFVEFGDIDIYEIPKGKSNNSTQLFKKIKNSTDANIIIVNSKYNTIIIRNEEFGVRGHFRLQPCGKNFIETKLIWIDSFKKHGYIRGAKSLKI